jgi:DNA-binding GntR family transcriptional regulator
MKAAEEAPSQTERAYRWLRAEILQGELMPGERLRPGDLQDRVAVGLTPIREALMRLASEGLVEAESHRGARVIPASQRELADLMETRRGIEHLCLARAITLGDAAWEAEIVAAMHLLSRMALPGSPEDREAAAEWERRHRRFHLALISACDSEWLLRFWNTLADHSERYRKVRLLHRHIPEAGVRDVNAEHAGLMDAVLRRDLAAATVLMDTHLVATETAIAGLLEENA